MSSLIFQPFNFVQSIRVKILFFIRAMNLAFCQVQPLLFYKLNICFVCHSDKMSFEIKIKYRKGRTKWYKKWIGKSNQPHTYTTNKFYFYLFGPSISWNIFTILIKLFIVVVSWIIILYIIVMLETVVLRSRINIYIIMFPIHISR